MKVIAEHKDHGDISVLLALSLMLVILEAAPGLRVEALSVRTSNTELEGVDALPDYDVPLPDDPEPVDVDISDVFNNDIVDINPDVVINLTGDTTGLDVVDTFDPNVDTPDNPGSDAIPDPGTFIPHSVPPRCTFRPSPEYPEMARLAGLEGRVGLQVFVGTDGFAASVVLMQSSGIASMDSAAVASARMTRWAPAEAEGGSLVGVWTGLVYEFALDN
jgi:TonB family protein